MYAATYIYPHISGIYYYAILTVLLYNIFTIYQICVSGYLGLIQVWLRFKTPLKSEANELFPIYIDQSYV